MPRALDLTGIRFARLVALRPSGSSRAGGVSWLCRCDCGAEITCSGKNLRSGNTKSCGCLNSQKVSERNQSKTTHGMTNTATFTVWVNMKQRCTNPKHNSYHRYGGRGIKVCERWMHSFENFLADMGERPFPDAEIDRKDNDGGYEPDNCRWVTSEQNKNNRAVSRKITFDGKTQTISQWAQEIGCSRQALRHRIENGWSAHDALTTPFNHGNCWRSRK